MCTGWASLGTWSIKADAFVLALRDLSDNLGFVPLSLDGFVEEEVCLDQGSGFPCADVRARYPKASAHSEPVLFIEDRDDPDVARDPELKASMHV